MQNPFKKSLTNHTLASYHRAMLAVISSHFQETHASSLQPQPPEQQASKPGLHLAHAHHRHQQEAVNGMVELMSDVRDIRVALRAQVHFLIHRCNTPRCHSATCAACAEVSTCACAYSAAIAMVQMSNLQFGLMLSSLRQSILLDQFQLKITCTYI